MEEIGNNEQPQRTVKIPAIEIIRKLKTKTDRQNFCRECSKDFLYNF